MSQEEKYHILRTVYYNGYGFGSVNETYKEAKKQLNSVTIEDTKKWPEQQKCGAKLLSNLKRTNSPSPQFQLPWCMESTHCGNNKESSLSGCANVKDCVFVPAALISNHWLSQLHCWTK